MSKAEEIFNKVNEMKLQDLMILCSRAIDMNMEKKRLDGLLMILETKLQAKRLVEMNKLSYE